MDQLVTRREPDARTTWRELYGRSDLFGENGFVARDILHSEVDFVYGQARREPYRLDEHARDILPTHTRQNVAHALLNTGSLLREVAALRRQVRALTALVGLLVVGLLGVVGLAAWAFGVGR